MDDILGDFLFGPKICIPKPLLIAVGIEEAGWLTLLMDDISRDGEVQIVISRDFGMTEERQISLLKKYKDNEVLTHIKGNRYHFDIEHLLNLL